MGEGEREREREREIQARGDRERREGERRGVQDRGEGERDRGEGERDRGEGERAGWVSVICSLAACTPGLPLLHSLVRKLEKSIHPLSLVLPPRTNGIIKNT